MKLADDNLFSEKGSEIFGRDKLQLINKIGQYKVLFPENVAIQKFKIKKNPTVEELQSYLVECSAIVETSCVESFVTDSILASMKMCEVLSTRTRFNIKGLSDMLRKHPQFNTLCKQLYIKYKVFSNIPPEAQMGLLVATSAYICYEKNKQEERNQSLLNKSIDVSQFE